jgi:hypothetical protein
MLLETHPDIMVDTYMWRCVNCGFIIDPSLKVLHEGTGHVAAGTLSNGPSPVRYYDALLP